MSKRERTRQLLQSAALDLFLDKGFDATTTREIAERAGVTEMTLFRHFPTKESLVLDDPYDPVIADAIRNRPRSESPMRAAVAGLGQAWANVPEAGVAALRSRLRILAEATTVRDLGRSVDRTRAAAAAALVDRGVRPRDALVVASAVIAGLSSALLAWARSEDDLAETITSALAVLGGERGA
ncbi:TetR/AcrR family transcriptional regulator [Microlunatus parietis]|uniref:AcrR family transcriptional regulator n=1 Tax=Microlunatus parietis TaxID=682979 RepID=A0A7Y9I4C0_9ACTN|nr:TetR/AcrR family transcriptional regulator [Microlunatus parietis]NYE69893.1 AcrR family transcriptional regulator [Microlunatus parietis]